jgi:hypothetical protein
LAERRWLRRLRRFARGAVFLGLAAWAGAALIFHPETPLPPAWNPALPLRVADPVTPVMPWKLWRTGRSDTLCRAALAQAANAEALSDFQESEACHIRRRVRLSSVGGAALAPLETRCDLALRLAMWERHGFSPPRSPPSANPSRGSSISRAIPAARSAAAMRAKRG